MRYFGFPRACLLLLVTWLGQGVIASSTPHTHRLLRAATKRADLYRRSVRISKRFEVEVGYVEEENAWAGTSTFASQVKVNSRKPILNLEEVEHHLQDVQCGERTMKLSFVDKSSARDAYHASYEQEKGGGLIVTSHEGCNMEGERSVYRVHDVSFADEGEALELLVTEASWQDAFDQFDISFGHTTADHLFRRHADFAKIRRKRQNFNVDIPADTPDDITTGTFDLKSELIDTTFAAESFLVGLEELVPIPQLPIEIGCKNCSTRGQVTLTQGAIKIDASQIDLIPDIFQGGDDGKEITSVVSGGFIELSATGVGARIELFARPKVSGAFEIALFPLPILGFVIPGIGKAGAVFEPRIAANFEISGGFELTYGIDVVIPDNSNIRLELTNIGNSGVNGFPGSTLTPLPFNVNITDVDILLGLAFKPTIPVGFEFLDKLKAEVFVTMNLPRLDAKLSTDAAANCGNSSNATTPAAPYSNKTTEQAGDILSLGPLVLVEANVSLTVDVGFSLNLPLLPPPFADINLDANIFSTVFPLVTACVDAAKSFPPMTAIGGANATATPGSSTPGSNSTVYVTATKTQTLTQIHTSAAHMNSTKAAVTSNHVAATTHVVEASSIHSNTTKATAISSRVVATTHIIEVSSMHGNTTEAMIASSHVIATTHVVESSSNPAHTASPMPVSSSAIATSHIIEAPNPAHMVSPTHVSSAVIASSHFSSKPANTTTSKPASTHSTTTQLLKSTPLLQPPELSNATAELPIPFPIASIAPSSIAAPAFPLASSVIMAPALSTPAAVSAASPAPTVIMSSGFLNSSGIAAQQTGPAIFTGAGVRGVKVWWTAFRCWGFVLGAGALVVL